jgi:hypothetical protein
MKIFYKLFIICSFIIWSTTIFADSNQLGIIITTGDSNGCYSWIQEQKMGPTRPAKHGMMLTTTADIHVSTNEQYYYILEGEDINRVTKFDIATQDNPKPVWQYSAKHASESGDTRPIDMVFVNTHKAYLLRYASTDMWVIDPSAADEASFYSATVDLSAYIDNDGAPEMTCGIIAGEKAFIVLKRIDSINQFDQTAYVAVIDINTDMEINTYKDQNLNGIPLSVKKPSAIHYLQSTDKLYVLGTDITEGGIEEIDPDGYTSTVIKRSSSQQYFTETALISDTDGFILTSSAPSDRQILCHLNISDKRINEVIFNTTVGGYLKEKKLKGLALDRHDRLWIGNQTDKKVVVVNTTPNAGKYQSEEDIDIPDNDGETLYPQQISFCMAPATTDTDEARKPSSAGESGNFCFIEMLFYDQALVNY